MASLQTRPAYSQEELEKLYPKDMQLQLVQIVRLLYCHIMKHVANLRRLAASSPRYTNFPLCLSVTKSHYALGERSPVSPRFTNVSRVVQIT
jgi:hypothetical protein